MGNRVSPLLGFKQHCLDSLASGTGVGVLWKAVVFPHIVLISSLSSVAPSSHTPGLSVRCGSHQLALTQECSHHGGFAPEVSLHTDLLLFAA